MKIKCPKALIILAFLCLIIVFFAACSPSPRYTAGAVIRKPGTSPKPEASSSGQSASSGKKSSANQQKSSVKEGMIFEGTASYYADDFHNKKTANGETYNMHGLTCAHKSWPFNTWIEVTNLANRRKVIVRVNDRGPYIGNRIIDLSLGAAIELDMINAGIQKVSIEILSTP